MDWSADYRLFGQDRFDISQLFSVCREEVLKSIPEGSPLVVAMDDSLFRKCGTKTHGVAYRRDPLGPRFRVNLVRAQRFLQISAALPRGQTPGPARMIPIDFRHSPTPTKPRKSADPQEWDAYKRLQKEQNISRIGLERLKDLRHALDSKNTYKNKMLTVTVDGGYTNGTVLKGLPHQTVLIGRIRKDAKLLYLPNSQHEGKKGRKKSYGDLAPTPEDVRQDPSIPYQNIEAWATGRIHDFKVKSMESLKWRTAGQDHILHLVVIAPLSYRLTAKSKILYRRPAYLICTDPKMSLREIIQYYLWRWDIEVNFRDEKHILGAGQAQVRKEHSVENVPGLIIASYAMLLLAAEETFSPDHQVNLVLPQPKWRREPKDQRASTQNIISHLRAELWGQSMGINNSSDFMNSPRRNMKTEKFSPNLPSAVLYAAA